MRIGDFKNWLLRNTENIVAALLIAIMATWAYFNVIHPT